MDPVPIIQQDIDRTINAMKRALQNREDMLNDSRGGNSDIFSSMGIQILNDAQNARLILNDIQESIDAVRNRTCDVILPEQTLQQRENYVRMTEDQITRIEREVASQNAKFSNIKTNKAKYAQFNSSSSNSNSNNPLANEESQLMSMSKTERLLQLERDVEMGVRISSEIKSELQSQQSLIKDLDEGVTNATEAMEKVTQRIKALIEAEGKTPTLLVAGLSVLFVILLFFVV